MPLTILKGSVVKQDTDIIVNAANNYLQEGGGVCGAIFGKVNDPRLQKECDKIGYCYTGEAVYTSGYSLCRYIIHTVGPIYKDGTHDEKRLLQNCYRNSLKLADELKVESISFPLISSGIYGYPKDEALSDAVEAIGEYLQDSDLNVSLCIYENPEEFLTAKNDILREKEERKHFAFAKKNYSAPSFSMLTNESCNKADEYDYEEIEACLSSFIPVDNIDELIKKKNLTFSQAVFKIIDTKGFSDTEVYKRANIDRRVFSKIRSDIDYHPSRQTALALVIALELQPDEADELMKKAGFAFSDVDKTDIIIRHYIENGEYNIHKINETLFIYDQKCLGV